MSHLPANLVPIDPADETKVMQPGETSPFLDNASEVDGDGMHERGMGMVRMDIEPEILFRCDKVSRALRKANAAQPVGE
jgi:hypothetical protein